MKNLRTYTSIFTFCLLIFSGAVLFLSFHSNPRDLPVTTQKCLIASDIHFNPLYGTSLTDTVLKRKLEHSTFDEWKKYFESSLAAMTLDSTLLGQDANYAVLQSAVLNMKKNCPARLSLL